ncbi:hypothetical protein GCK32_013049 [Trichostrongylus colubriformis]|uniref:Secreted protein n=1 Tax=Trichostrongylus colubriformis TaxID=6319 RepID=A0AAN8FI59_TRICO
MLSLLNVLLFSLVHVSIFDVTEKVLGLREADFKNGPRKAVVLSRMDSCPGYRKDEVCYRTEGARRRGSHNPR